MLNAKLKPVLTEKSLRLAKRGCYTFIVNCEVDKEGVKKLVEKTFDVHVTSVRTMNYKKVTRKNYRGKIQTQKAYKKALVSLAEKEKIDLFEEKAK